MSALTDALTRLRRFSPEALLDLRHMLTNAGYAPS